MKTAKYAVLPLSISWFVLACFTVFYGAATYSFERTRFDDSVNGTR